MSRWRYVIPLLLAGLSLHAAEKSSCEPDLIAEVPLRVMPNGTVYFPATVAGQEVYFDLSIGSGLPFIGEAAARALQLAPRALSGSAEVTVGGRRLTHYVSLEDVSIGGYRLATRAAPLVPEPGEAQPMLIDGKPYVGRLGSTFLRRVDVEIALAEGKMRLFRQFKCYQRSPAYWGGEVAALPLRFDAAESLVFNLELNGKKVESSLLSGNTVSTIDVNLTRKYLGFDETSPGVQPGPRGDFRQFHAMSLGAGTLRLDDVPVALQRGRDCEFTGSRPTYGGIGYSRCLNMVPFTLGTDLISRMRIYIATHREQVYISLLPGAGEPAPTGPGLLAPPIKP